MFFESHGFFFGGEGQGFFFGGGGKNISGDIRFLHDMIISMLAVLQGPWLRSLWAARQHANSKLQKRTVPPLQRPVAPSCSGARRVGGNLSRDGKAPDLLAH